MSTQQQANDVSLPPAGQYSLRALFIATVISAVVFAILAPAVRRWPQEYQIHFAAVATACIGLPAAIYMLQLWRRRRLEQQSGKLLAYFPGRSGKVTSILCAVWLAMTFAVWYLFLHLAAAEGLSPPDSWYMLILVCLLNSGNLWAYSSRGVQLRERGLIWQGVRFEWRHINRYTWPSDSKLVLFLAGRMTFAIPIPPDARETIEQVLRVKVATAFSE